MVCANITFKMLLGMAIYLSSLPDVAGWWALQSNSRVNVSLSSLLWSVVGIQCPLANGNFICRAITYRESYCRLNLYLGSTRVLLSKLLECSLL